MKRMSKSENAPGITLEDVQKHFFIGSYKKENSSKIKLVQKFNQLRNSGQLTDSRSEIEFLNGQKNTENNTFYKSMQNKKFQKEISINREIELINSQVITIPETP